MYVRDDVVINLRHKTVFYVIYFLSYEAGKVCHLAHSELSSLASKFSSEPGPVVHIIIIKLKYNF